MTVHRTHQRRLLVSMAVASTLLLAACGGGGLDTEVATTNDGAPTSPAIDSSDSAEIDTGVPVDLAVVVDDDPVPRAALPPDPEPATSPADRQRLQELGLHSLPEVPAESPAERDDGVDQDENLSEVSERSETSARPDISQFPAEIPAVIRDAPSGDQASEVVPPASFSFAPLDDAGWDRGSAEFDKPVDLEVEDLDAGAESVEVEATLQPDDPTDGSDEDFDDDPICPDGSECEDFALHSGDGVGDAGVVSPDVSDRHDGSLDSDDERSGSVDCDARPYDRGCPLPTGGASGSAHSEDDADTGATGNTTTGNTTTGNTTTGNTATGNTAGVSDVDSAHQGEGEGVDVPQDVIDALLGPLGDDDDVSVSRHPEARQSPESNANTSSGTRSENNETLAN